MYAILTPQNDYCVALTIVRCRFFGESGSRFCAAALCTRAFAPFYCSPLQYAKIVQ